jgi:hypothetical protein
MPLHDHLCHHAQDALHVNPVWTKDDQTKVGKMMADPLKGVRKMDERDVRYYEDALPSLLSNFYFEKFLTSITYSLSSINKKGALINKRPFL